MKNTLKFGVAYRRNSCSDESKTLMTVDATSSLQTIIQQACAKFCPPENHEGIYEESNQLASIRNQTSLPMNNEEYCFLKRDEDGRPIQYITEENRHLISENIVHLVPIPSVAAQQLIKTIESVLNGTRLKDKDFQTIFGALTEITDLLPCKEFATEFLKARGHESIFRLVELFCHLISGEQNSVPSSPPVLYPPLGWWNYFAACLVELAEYGLNSSKDEDSDGDEEGSLDKEKRDTPVAHLSEAPEFSWFLVSESFLSSLILQCRLATELKTLRDSVRTLLKIMNDCPDKAEQVIQLTGPAFIFELLEKVHELQKASTQVDAPQANTTQRTFRNVLLRVSLPSAYHLSQLTRFDSSTSVASATDQTHSPTDQLPVELISLLLDMLYLILYHSQQSGKLSERFQLYLSASHLRKLFTYYPQLRRPSTSLDRNHQLNGTEPTANQLDCARHDPAISCNDGTPVSTRSTFYFQDVCNLPVQSNGNNSFRSHKTENDVVAGLLRIQKVYLAYLAGELQVSLDDESPSGLEKLDKLCQLATPELDPMLSDPDRTELLYTQLGFKNPKNPLEEFHPSPGRLGYTTLYSFFEHHNWLLKQMLNYRPDTHRSVLNPMSCSTLRKISSGTRISLRPSKSVSSIKEVSNPTLHSQAGTPNPYGRRKTVDTFSFTQSSTTDVIRPLFPVVATATELVKMLCDVLNPEDAGHTVYLKPLPRWHTRPHDSPSKLFYPLLFQPRNQVFTPFQELFASTFVVLFDTWTQLNAGPGDLDRVISVVREQLTQTLDQNPHSFDEYERILTRCTPRFVRTAWKKIEEQSRGQRMDTHRVLKGLKERLTMSHEPNVKEQRLNYIFYHGVLEYSPTKLARKEVVLSPDRKSLLIYDAFNPSSTQTPQQLRHLPYCDIWPLPCVERVKTGVEERVKKNPERTLVLYRRTHESLETHQLVARNDLECTYWLDAFSILLKCNPLSDTFHKDVQRLVELDQRVRLCGLNLHLLPTKLKDLPPDPPEFDFDEERQ